MAACVLAYDFVVSSSDVKKAPAPRHIGATLQGFEKGSEISYRVVLSNGKASYGKEIVGEDGAAYVPVDPLAENSSGKTIYDLSVPKKDGMESMNVIFALEPQSGKISVLGRGFDDFSFVKFSGKEGEIESKADWSGNIKHEGTLRSAEKEQPGSYKIAVYGNDFAGAIGPNPKIIEVFQAKGGGTRYPKDNELNRYTNLYCETLIGEEEEDSGGTSDDEEVDETKNMVPSTCRKKPMQTTMVQLKATYAAAFIMMGRQFSAVMMQQMSVVGALIDAKQQLETQRHLQMLQAQAHKDYHPSDTMCRFGSFIKSVPRTEARANVNKQALNAVMMASYTNEEGITGGGVKPDFDARVKQFRMTYCNPADNNNGLELMCEHDQNQIEKDSVIGEVFPKGTGAPQKEENPK